MQILINEPLCAKTVWQEAGDNTTLENTQHNLSSTVIIKAVLEIASVGGQNVLGCCLSEKISPQLSFTYPVLLE